MKQEKALPQGTPREDNPNIVEWFADNGSGDILQLVYRSTSTSYRFVRKGIVEDGCYYPARKFSLWSMLDLLNR